MNRTESAGIIRYKVVAMKTPLGYDLQQLTIEKVI